jgi:hypothetical protein
LVLLVIAVLGGKAWVQGYLRSDRFRHFIDRKAGQSLEAQATLAPLSVSGQSFHSESFKALGYEGSWFSEIRLEQLRANLSTRRFSERVWQVEEVEVQRAAIKIEGGRLTPEPKLPKDGSGPQFRAPGFLSALLPNRVEIANATIREASIDWGHGSFTKSALTITPQDGGWMIQARGGIAQHAKLPSAELTTARIRYKAPSLYVQEAELRQGEGGRVSVTGEIRFEDSVDLLAKLENVSMSPYLEGDWRARLHGKVSGDVRVRSPLKSDAVPVISGTVYLREGQLEALPILDTIASFTRTAQFKKVNLTSAVADFTHEGDRLEVSKFTVESAGLIRIDGAFTVLNGEIDGEVQLGVTPASLQWLPGSQDRVFTVSRDGYLWAPVRLSGPAAKPKEDLSPRLVAAAKSALFESAEGAAKGATETTKDIIKGATEAAKGALDAILGR